MFFPNYNFTRRKESCSLPRAFIDSLFQREKASAFTSGSLTLEAACVLPFFLAAMMAVMILIQGTALSCRVSEGLHEAGKQMALLAYAKEATGIDTGKYVTGALSYVYVQGKLKDKMADQDPYVSLMRSSLPEEDEIIDLVGEYILESPIPLFRLRHIRMVQRARIRAWTGRKAKPSEGEGETGGETVYITVNGSVYHRDQECTHIRLSIRSVDRSVVAGLRNSGGGKYYPCSGCQGDNAGQVYITDTGDRYHSSTGCSGLKRGVITTTLAEVESWTPCSRCGR